MASYISQINKIHRQFNSSLKRAKSRQSVLNAYWAHKKAHEKLLKSHLKEELRQVNKIKNKMKYR